jgi:hypothetical protein
MEDKRGTKCSRSPSKDGSSSPSDSSTPPLAISESPPPSGSPSKISLCRPCSLVFEQGGPSEKDPVVDLSLSSDEEGLIPVTSWDQEFTKRLFGDLNHDVLGPPGDGNIIILSNSDEEEVREEDAIDAEAAPSSAAEVPASTPPPPMLMRISRGCKIIIVTILSPIRRQAMVAAVETRLVHLRLPRQGGASREACFKENFNGSTLLLHILFCAEELGW